MDILDELLNEEASTMSYTNDELIVNANDRTIYIPNTLAGVASDEKSTRLKFRCSRYVGDDIDLSTMNVYINFKNANGKVYRYITDDVTVEGDDITFSWLIGRDVTTYKGDVEFIVCAKEIQSDGKVSVEWNTTIATLKVLEGLEPSASYIPTESVDVATELRNKIKLLTSEIDDVKNELSTIPDGCVTEDELTNHTSDNDIHVTVSDKANWNGKLNSNQGVSNAGKVLGTNSIGDVVPISGYGFEYDKTTQMLKYGVDPSTNLNQGIGLDDTLTKSGFAADSAKVGEIKEDLDKLIKTNKYTSDRTKTEWYEYSITSGNSYKVSNNSDGGAIAIFACSSNGDTGTVETINSNLGYGHSCLFKANSNATYIRIYFSGTYNHIVEIEDLNGRIGKLEIATSKNELDISSLSSEKLSADKGKNLYDKNSDNKVEGFYFAYNNGVRQTNSSFMAICIPVNGGEKLSINKGGVHVCVLSEIQDLPSFANNSGTLNGYIEGFADSSPKQGYTIPSNAKCIVVSHAKNDKDTIQVEYGNESTSYEPYTIGLNANRVIGINAELTVGVGYQYETITDAVTNAKDGDTILVMKGTYNESIDIRGKDIKIKGFSRDECILTYSASDYLVPPLEMAKGIVEDMTIIATGTEKAEGASFLAYCVHIDFGEERNNSLMFKNCRFKNDARQCVGIGTRGNFRLSFINCEFEVDTDGSVYLHEEQASNVSNQYVEFIDCSFKRNSNGFVILMQESTAYTNNNATVKFQRCIAKNKGGAVIGMQQYGTQTGLTGDGYLGSTVWTLDTASTLNSDALLNSN